MNGGSAASNSKKDIPAGGLTQKDLRAGSLTEGRKNSREEELESSISLFCGNEHATLVIFLLQRGRRCLLSMMVRVTKKSSLDGHVGQEAEDGSGERYTIRQMNL
jgi:hypothetical protein